jgi:hypothetical protein
MSANSYGLAEWECMDLIRERSVGRLCIVDHGYPLAIPVNYTMAVIDGDNSIVVRTAPETMLGHYEGLGSFEVDDIDLAGGHAWSVIVRGNVRRVVGSHALPDPRPLLTEDRHQWMVLHKASVSGRRFVVERASEGYFVDWQIAPV